MQRYPKDEWVEHERTSEPVVDNNRMLGCLIMLTCAVVSGTLMVAGVIYFVRLALGDG